MSGALVRFGEDGPAIRLDAILGVEERVFTADGCYVLLEHGHRVSVSGMTVEQVLDKIREAGRVRLPGVMP